MQNSRSSFRQSALAASFLVAVLLPHASHAQTICSATNQGPGCTSVAAPAETPPHASLANAAPAPGHWVATREASLRELLSQWSARAGWQEPTWTLKPEEDFTLGASMEFEGEVMGAVTALFDAFPAEAKLRVRMFSTNRLMIVEQAPSITSP